MNQRRSQAAVNRPSLQDTETFGQVLAFRRPGTMASIQPAGRFRPGAGLADDLADDFASYEQERENDGVDDLEDVVDYRQRMMMNFIALAVVAFLVGAGVWLADTIADMERDQDCVLQGRQNCAPIEVPAAIQK